MIYLQPHDEESSVGFFCFGFCFFGSFLNSFLHLDLKCLESLSLRPLLDSRKPELDRDFFSLSSYVTTEIR